MTADILTLEVGSTITKANAFRRDRDGVLVHVAQGFATTSIDAGDVGVGVDEAVQQLQLASGVDVGGAEVFVNSSAAGGLRMTVHGLTQGMTARAAREAALGAGAIVRLVTAGALTEDDLEQIRDIEPNIVLLAGGVDHGERNVVVHNARRLAELGGSAPVVYAGNVAARREVERILRSAGAEVSVTDNVFPDVDVLAMEPVRRLVHEEFNRHIVHAPGMARLAERTTAGILPTPGAVLRAAELFAQAVGECVVVDVGGATTDVHSVTDGSAYWTARTVDPEPRSKRTVEGDLGVFVNARNVAELAGDDEWQARLADLSPTPGTDRQRELTGWLCTVAVETAVRRHAGVISDLFTPTGRTQIVRGKDLSAVEWVVGTGGALTRVPGGAEVLRGICRGPARHLLPGPDATVLIDRDYRFSALGTVAQAYPDEVAATLRRWATSTPGRADRRTTSAR